MKKSERKLPSLQLSRERIRELTPTSLGHVVGGAVQAEPSYSPWCTTRPPD